MAGFACVYDYFDTAESDGYTWYRIAENQWIANEGSYLEVCAAKRFSFSYTAPKNAAYIITLKSGEKLSIYFEDEEIFTYEVLKDAAHKIAMNKDELLCIA